MCSKNRQLVPMSISQTYQQPADRARGFLSRMILHEARGTSDTEPALRRLARDYGLNYWTIDRIRRGKAKSVDAGLFNKIRDAYLSHCRWKLKSLAHEIRLERASGNDVDADILAEAETLLAKIEERRRT